METGRWGVFGQAVVKVPGRCGRPREGVTAPGSGRTVASAATGGASRGLRAGSGQATPAGRGASHGTDGKEATPGAPMKGARRGLTRPESR
ncbi:hypothetical protein GCM10010341_06300 [Streptomyces noursei]|nr:hypothetical protein GCM10010341_06300 [Streptomyces noursei]